MSTFKTISPVDGSVYVEENLHSSKLLCHFFKGDSSVIKEALYKLIYYTENIPVMGVFPTDMAISDKHLESILKAAARQGNRKVIEFFFHFSNKFIISRRKKSKRKK